MKEDALVNLYIIDGSHLSTSWGGKIYLVSPEQTGGKVVKFIDERIDSTKLVNYQPVPIAATDFKLTGSNRLPNPKVAIGNVDGQLTNLSYDFEDLIGFKFWRIRTYAKYLHSVGGTSVSTYDPSAVFAPELWYFNRKTEETNLGVIYELASAMDLEGLQIPSRKLYSNYCPFAYGSPECGSTSSKTTCAKTLSDCKERNSEPFPFGGFPAATS
jgi:lambda family phage minor tail protein L